MNINEVFPSKYLKSADIKGRPPLSVVIREVTLEEMAEGEHKPVLYFQGKQKGVVLNKTNSAMIAHTHSPETDNWIGKTILLRSEPVSFGGKIVDSIRVACAQGRAEVYHNEQAVDHNTLMAGEAAGQDISGIRDDSFDDDISF